MKEIVLEAEIGNIPKIIAFINEALDARNIGKLERHQIDIAVDEILSNIAHYAYNPDVGEATVRVEVEEEPLSVIITFIDGGVPYDPLQAAEPDTTLSAEERALGGLGIFMVRKSMDEITYRYENGRNILSIRKTLRS